MANQQITGVFKPMLTPQERLVIGEAASILHKVARDFKDKYDRLSDMERSHEKMKAQFAYEHYVELNKLGHELTEIAAGKDF